MVRRNDEGEAQRRRWTFYEAIRIGLEAVRGFQEDVVPIVQVEFVTPDVHRAGMAALLSAGRRKLSLVDCVSFELMRDLGIKIAFTFDSHFKEQGFATVP